MLAKTSFRICQGIFELKSSTKYIANVKEDSKGITNTLI